MAWARERCSVSLALWALFVGVTGCGASSFDGHVYDAGEWSIRVGDKPASWKALDVDGAALAFRDEATLATIAVGGRCHQDGDDVPLPSLTQHLFLHFSERTIVSEELVPLDGREALHSVISAKLDGVEKRFDVWVLKKDGCVFDLYLIAEPSGFDAAVGPFRGFVAGFATVKTPEGDSVHP